MVWELVVEQMQGRKAATAVPFDWRGSYARRLVITDLLVLIWVVMGVQIAWFGFGITAVDFTGNQDDLAFSYTAVSVLVIASWMVVLGIYGTRGYRVVGTGTAEYKLISDASIRLFGLVAIIAFLSKIDLARGYVLIAFPLGILVLIFSRWMWRQWLTAQRAKGTWSSIVVLVGTESSVVSLSRELARQPGTGYVVAGACISAGSSSAMVPGLRSGSLTGIPTVTGSDIPILGTLDDVTDALALTGADTVIITTSEGLPPARLRQLSWQLEPGRHHLVVAPGLTDIGGPRIHMRPVAGLPLIHVETPRYEGAVAFTKRTFDVIGSAILLIILSPLLIAIAIAIMLSSPGPMFYRSERIGFQGTPFPMLKFRSMRFGAHLQLDELLAQQGTAGVPLFKVKDDPRITPLGRVLRRYSLDELPQLFNVLNGSMSLVGPRPQIAAEVALYDDAARRRLLLKPGVSGLWQVSGRSNLSWEDSIRLDLYYVENWSITGDIVILWRTARAVVTREGAY